MARIHEEHIVIKLSKIAPDSGEVSSVVTSEIRDQFLEIAKELFMAVAGEHVVVEVETTDHRS